MINKKILFIGHSKIVHKNFNFELKKYIKNYTYIYCFDYIKKNGHLDFCEEIENIIKSGVRNIIIEASNCINIFWLKKIRLIYNLRIILIASDDEYLFNDQTIFFSKISDYVLTTDINSINKLKKIKVISSFFHNPPLANIKNNIKKSKYDVSFVGSLRKPGRQEYINFLRTHRVDVKVFDSSKKKISYNKMFAIFNNTKINLNFSRISLIDDQNFNNEKRKGFKGRVGEIFSSNSFCLSEESNSLKKIYSIIPSIFFRNKKELLTKIIFFLKHSKLRKKIIKKMNYYVIKNFSSKVFIDKILYIFENHHSLIRNNNLEKSKLINEKLLTNFFLSNLNSTFSLFFRKPIKFLVNFFYIVYTSFIIPLKIKNFNIMLYLILIVKKINYRFYENTHYRMLWVYWFFFNYKTFESRI